MNPRFAALGALAIALLLAGCASAFKPVHREALDYVPAADSAGLPLQYRVDVLDESSNVHYAEMARLYGFRFMAVKVTNTRDRPLSLKTDVTYHAGDRTLRPLSIDSTLPLLRQKTGAYAFYLLLMPVNVQKKELKCDGYGCGESAFIPVGLILGPVFALWNMAVSSGANNAFAEEFAGNDLSGKVLRPGERATGYLAFHDTATAPLSIRPR
ncbi:MAG: hypothetical protein K0Q91_2230 [Fibrobacteria bacterium]|nr:hypothetical protein [Fibrobacteria bacterium]